MKGGSKFASNSEISWNIFLCLILGNFASLYFGLNKKKMSEVKMPSVNGGKQTPKMSDL
jgi:hypothetical protein